DISWKRIPGGSSVQPLVEQAIETFDPLDPSASVPLLLRIRKEIFGLGDSVWKRRKLRETEELIVDCLGLYLEASASHYQVAPGEPVEVSIEMLNRSSHAVAVTGIDASGVAWDTTLTKALHKNRPEILKLRTQMAPDAEYTHPYWLTHPHTTGLYTVKDPEQIGMPEHSPVVNFTFTIELPGERMTITRPLVYKWVDPVKGERWRPFEVVPPVTVNLSEEVMVFGTREPRTMSLLIRSSSVRP